MSQRKTCYFSLLTVLLLSCLLPSASWAQLYPGDANNDGLVNNVDVLYIGYAYGSYGPVRPKANVDFSEAAVPLFWSQLFPDSTNFAYADTDGSGLVDFSDFLTVYSNYGSKRLNPSAPAFLAGIPGFDPQLRLGAVQSRRPLRAGDTLSIPILLEAPNAGVLESVNGIAFSLELDTRFFKTFYVTFEPSWLQADSSLFQFQIPVSNRLEIAATRFGANPVRGKGQIGTLRAVIEDDLIGLSVRDSVSTMIEAKLIKLVDGVFREVPVAGSQQQVLIYDEDALVHAKTLFDATAVLVFPNPSAGTLQIDAIPQMEKVEIYNVAGQLLASWQMQNIHQLNITIPDMIEGLIFIKIYTKEGILLKKIFVQHHK